MRAYRIAYDGGPYHGFQRQPDVPTVADALLDALVELDVLAAGDGDGSRPVPPGWAAAGRTDAGVSALAQTVAFRAPDWLEPAAFDAELPPDVRAWAGADVPSTFHATHDAVARSYAYYLHAPAADDDLAEEAVSALAGEHDFHNLTPDEEGTERTLAADVERDGPFIVLRASADGFPRHLVRRLAAAVDAVAHGRRELAWIDRLLAPEPVAGPEGVPTAPATPLVLTDVAYPDVEFEPDATAADAARELFEDRRADRLTAARVAGRIAEGVGSRSSLE